MSQLRDTGGDAGSTPTGHPLRSAPAVVPDGLCVGLLGAAPLVGHGVRAILGSRGHRVHPAASPADLPRASDAVILDVWSLGERALGQVHALVTAGHGPVVCLGPGASPQEWRRLREAGAHSYLSVRLPGAELVRALEDAVVSGEQDTVAAGTGRASVFDRLGCTDRESEILTLIARGLTNKEIATELFLGINTIKTYIRGAYRKVGVSSRTEAVIWALEHGV